MTKKIKKPNLEIIEDLKNSSLDAFEHGHYLQSAIIIFQTVENLLRIAIRGYGKGHGISEDSLKKAADASAAASAIPAVSAPVVK